MQYLKLILHLSSQDQCLPSFQGLSTPTVLKLWQTQREAQNSWMPLHKHVWYHAEPHRVIPCYPMPRPWIDHGHSWFCHVCSQDFLMFNSVCNNTLDEQIRRLSPINKNMTIWEETRHWLYVFIKTTTTTDTTMRAHDTFCPLLEAWHVNCPFNCPITLSNYKHGAYTVPLVLKSSWW